MLSMMNASPRASRDASGSSGAASPDSYNPVFSGSDQENYAHDQRQSLPMQGSLGKPRAIAVRGDGAGAPPVSTSASMGKQSAAAARKEKRSTKSKCPPGLRSGKWTPEEEAYTNTIIHYFKRGLLDIDDGTSLRWFLAKRLNCEAMRVTKKLKGNSSIGKQIFRALENTPENRMAILHAKDELAVLERQFLDSLLAAGQAGQTNGMGLMRGRGGRPGSGGRPATLQDDANLLLHFFVGAHDNADPDDSQPARATNPSNMNLNVQLKIDKKRPFTSISNTASSESSSSSSAIAAASSEKRGASASASPSKRRSGVKIEDLMD